MNSNVQTGRLSKIWWLPLITGLICIGLGVWTLLDPSESIPVFALTFTALLMAAGIAQMCSCIFIARVGASWGWSLVIGLLDIIASVWLFSLPESVLTTTFIYIIAIWILVVAINAVIEATAMASYSPFSLVLMIILLIATIAFEVIFLSNPILSGMTAWLWLGLSLISFGVYRLILSHRIHNLRNIRLY